MASFVFYGITCQTIEFAALFATFEESMCSTSGARQVAPPEERQDWSDGGLPTGDAERTGGAAGRGGHGLR